jgi:hypothetical protein
MTTKTTDRTTSADLARRLRERAAEYEEAGREKLRAESALLAAMANYERARYRERQAREEWAARTHGLVGLDLTDGGGCHLQETRGNRSLCGATLGAAYVVDTHRADCPACLAALDEVAP